MTAARASTRSAARPESLGRADFTAAAITMAAVLGSLGCALALRAQTAGFAVQNVVVAVVLTLTLTRMESRSLGQRAVSAVALPIVALAASAAGWLVVHEPWVGQPLLVVALCVGILARRYGPVVRRAGRLVALPFLALLITPAPAMPDARTGSILWAPLVALIAVVWSSAADTARSRLLPLSPRHDERQGARARRRWDAPTRMAAQMAVGLGSAFVVGHLFFGERWAWTVLSAYLVASGNRGRGDVVHKAGLRVFGAGIGTLVASTGASGLTPGNRWLLVALFLVMGIALVLRRRSYAFWAAGVTAMVALLHGYYGESGTSVLGERLLGVLIGSLLGVAAAWFVLPIRTSDVLRRRLADCLAALTDDLGDGFGAARTEEPLARLNEIAPTLRAHHRTLGRRQVTAAATAIPAMHALAAEAGAATDADRRRLRQDIVRVRRAIVGKDDPSPAELPDALATISAVLESTRH